jgi:hypothetical protein
MKALNKEYINVLIDDVPPTTFERIIRNMYRTKTVDDQVKELKSVFERYPKKMGQKNKEGRVYNRTDEISKALNKKYSGKETISKLSHSKIYEFIYNKDTAEFTPIKERTDKVKPNFIEVVHDNLETILYPVNVELIKRNQDKFFNLKRFHNWVKRNFLQKYASYKNCIDIGCGRGGDIQKWFDYKIKYIEAYDINEESITEAVNRYTLYKNNNIYKSNYNYNLELL